MVDILPVSSAYTFTENVRMFKENDVYYYQVDNIPIGQLAENTLWLKDQIGVGKTVSDVTRRDIAELKPHVDGTDRVAKVKPGRFSARINDAYTLTPLQTFIQATGQDEGSVDSFLNFAGDSPDSTIGAVLELFKTTIAANSQNLNGLLERTFTYPVTSSDFPAIDFTDPNNPTTINIGGTDKPVFPLSEILLWAYAGNTVDRFTTKTFNTQTRNQGFLALSRLEAEFTKRWRGVARTSIVDVPEELSITIPAFDPTEHYYTDSNGSQQFLPASQRIDLLFIYSKPVDASSTTVAKYVNGEPTRILKAELGIIKGAGLGVDFSPVETSIDVNFVPESGIGSNGVQKMLADASDELNIDNGFSGISVHGSFPSPDDLANLAPLLSYKLESNSYSLIGQSILPVAYIVSRAGEDTISETDLIDIRPFFRTAELAYNERAGIAAAMPQLSFANPAVGKSQLDYEVFRVNEALGNRISQLEGGQGETSPRVVGSGYIFGGFNFGVEGVQRHYVDAITGHTKTIEELRSEVKRRFNLIGKPIPDFPDWDTARWLDEGNFSEKGNHVNDYINVMTRSGRGTPMQFGSFPDSNYTGSMLYVGTDNILGNDTLVNLQFVKKTIKLDRSKVSWMQDYIVHANLLNCVPLTCRAGGFTSDEYAGGAGIWIEKGFDEFTIYCAWVANDPGQHNPNATETPIMPSGGRGEAHPYNNRDEHWFSAFIVMNQEIMNYPNVIPVFPGQANAGIATYPTVTFTVVGIPGSFPHATALYGKRPTIELA